MIIIISEMNSSVCSLKAFNNKQRRCSCATQQPAQSTPKTKTTLAGGKASSLIVIRHLP